MTYNFITTTLLLVKQKNDSFVKRKQEFFIHLWQKKFQLRKSPIDQRQPIDLFSFKTKNCL